MVFSQTSLKTQNILKVVELDRLKPEKNQQVDEVTGAIVAGDIDSALPSHMAATSFSEVYLKPEPVFESTMFHDSDCEFFQDLVQWCSDPAKEEQVLTTDSPKKIEESAQNTDTLHTPFSPQGWEVFDANSPAHAGYYLSTPNDPMSPNMDGLNQIDNKFLYPIDIENGKKVPPQESSWNISNLPVVLGDLASEKMVDLNPLYVTEAVDPYYTTQTEYTTSIDTQNKMLLFDEDEYLDTKLDSVIPREVENNNVVISEYILNDPEKGGVLLKTREERRGPGLSLNVTAPVPWLADAISTPEVLSYVVQMEKDDTLSNTAIPQKWPLQDTGFPSTESSPQMATNPPTDYEPITPKTESHLESDVDDTKSRTGRRRRHDSEDSDETYTPHTEYSPRKYKRRKPNIPIKDMIIALEGSQQLKKPSRRGRPPKRRDSTVSSVCSVDDNASSVSTQDNKYRELRDKNNEASKKSRMNRKLKELQVEQLAEELEERNKKLKVKADILEDMTKRLKDILMKVILQK